MFKLLEELQRNYSKLLLKEFQGRKVKQFWTFYIKQSREESGEKL